MLQTKSIYKINYIPVLLEILGKVNTVLFTVSKILSPWAQLKNRQHLFREIDEDT